MVTALRHYSRDGDRGGVHQTGTGEQEGGPPDHHNVESGCRLGHAGLQRPHDGDVPEHTHAHTLGKDSLCFSLF